jgi:hypothetical protein
MSYTAAEQAELTMLQQLVNGVNPMGGKVSMGDRMSAAARLREILENRKVEERRRTEVDRTHALTEDQQQHAQGMDKDKLQLEVTKAQAEITVENRKLDLEAERIEIAKAEVIVRALEAAARHPELKQLTQIVGEMSYRLMGGEMLPALEDHSSED